MSIKPLKRGYAAIGQTSRKVSLRIKTDTIDKIDALAKLHGVNRSSVIVHAVEILLKESCK